MRPSWHFIISLVSLIIYVFVTKTPPNLIWVSSGVIFGVLIDVDNILHGFVFHRGLTLNHLRHLDLAGFLEDFKDEGIFDNVWFHGILWKNMLYYLFMHGLFILFVFWVSPYIFGSLDIPIRVAIIVHYLSDIFFHTYTRVLTHPPKNR